MDLLEKGISLGGVSLGSESTSPSGKEALAGLVNGAATCLRRLREAMGSRGAAIGRIRGTGPGVSFGALVDRIESSFPLALRSPFEGSNSVGGAVLTLDAALGEPRADALLKLRFAAGSVDLPMHAHEHSDRFIFVISGRGFFHISDRPVSKFDGANIRSVPVRDRDALMFLRGTVHTFSAPTEPLVLLSYHQPYIALDDARQYTLPACRACPMTAPDEFQSRVSCDPAWTILHGGLPEPVRLPSSNLPARPDPYDGP